MKKIMYIIMVMLLSIISIFTLAGCDDINMNEIVENTNNVWNEYDTKTAIEKVVLKDVNIAGIATIQNIDINIERVFNKESTMIKINTSNFAIKINKEVEEAVQIVLNAMNMSGAVSVRQLESIISKISFDLNSTMTKTNIKGTLKINNVVNLFSAQKSEALVINFDKTLDDSNMWLTMLADVGRDHLINQFAPTGDKNIETGISHDVEFIKTDGIEIAKSILAAKGDEPLANPDYTINKIFHNSFGTSDAEKIINERIILDNLTAKYELSSKESIKYISKMSIVGDLNIAINNDEIFALVENITSAINSPETNQIFCIMGMIFNFDKSIAVGKVIIDCDYKIS